MWSWYDPLRIVERQRVDSVHTIADRRPWVPLHAIWACPDSIMLGSLGEPKPTKMMTPPSMPAAAMSGEIGCGDGGDSGGDQGCEKHRGSSEDEAYAEAALVWSGDGGVWIEDGGVWVTDEEIAEKAAARSFLAKRARERVAAKEVAAKRAGAACVAQAETEGGGGARLALAQARPARLNRRPVAERKRKSGKAQDPTKVPAAFRGPCCGGVKQWNVKDADGPGDLQPDGTREWYCYACKFILDPP